VHSIARQKLNQMHHLQGNVLLSGHVHVYRSLRPKCNLFRNKCNNSPHSNIMNTQPRQRGGGFTNAADRNRLKAFIRRAVRHGYCAHTTPTLSSLCDKADKTLFDSIISSSTHPLHILLPPKVQKHYFTGPRGHCYELPCKTIAH